MATNVSRRDFLKYAGGGMAGMAALVVGSKLGWVLNDPHYVSAAVQTVELEIGDAIKQMVTHNTINDARCYFWIYKSVVPDLPAECPGPIIFATQGDTVNIKITNRLDEPHAFAIPGIFDSGPIAPAAVFNGSFVVPATKSGAFMYFDNLNAPVNRVMGLHGAFVIMPAAAVVGHKWTPYHSPTAPVQKLFDDFGSAHFPGLAWEQGDPNPASFAPPFRTYVWVDHQASPLLFQEVGNSAPGAAIRNPVNFVEAFLRDPFTPTPTNRRPQYFTINGQSGHFAHNNPHICPNLRVGEPCVVHILNAGLWTHSMHVHANHFYVTSVNNVVSDNPLWLDTFEIEPMDAVDYIFPYMRPPDVPNVRGIGRADTPLTAQANAGIPGSVPHPTWPPTEELNTFFPPVGTVAGAIPIHVQLSPLCYPMHDHSEPSQTAQGGNYNLGLISGINFTGDRNINPAAVTTFPNAPPPSEFPPNATGPAAPPM